MFITNTVTKKILESIVHETFSNLGSLYSSALLDSLKLLGFYYATNAGVSINTEDLKTPKVKSTILKIVEDDAKKISDLWIKGTVSNAERFQSIIDCWNVATDSLKSRIINYYQNFDPANNLYIMAFSGARGNISQVRQLIGMRGLMSDQEGNIIDLPIQTNFREGLSSIDYMISSYGARKGIVDTALKTADSGYLTRRLIYVAQDLIIRELKCNSTDGLLLYLNTSVNCKNIIGRILLTAKNCKENTYDNKYQNCIITGEIINKLKKNGPSILNVRSPLTCLAVGSICQACYGWDLSRATLISLGEVVGVIAAQSIGEPGTQLTMRTFHTGGIFTSETLQQTLAPFTGILCIPSNLKGTPCRSIHGKNALKLQQDTKIEIINLENKTITLHLEIGSFLYYEKSCFIKKGAILAEQPLRSIVAGIRNFKPVYTSTSGEIRYESLLIRSINREYRPKIKVNHEDGLLWIISGHIYTIPKEAHFSFLKNLKRNKVFARLRIVTPYGGIFRFDSKNFFISNRIREYRFAFDTILKKMKNNLLNISITANNCQYVDPFTTIGYINIYANELGPIYSTRKKESAYLTNYFLSLESDTWRIHSDIAEILSPKVYRKGHKLNNFSICNESGFLLKKDGLTFIFQKATPIFLSNNTILSVKQGDLVRANELLATLINRTQQTEDIVQGLPKIEELVEARSPKQKAELAIRPGVIISGTLKQHNETFLVTKAKFDSLYKCLISDEKAELSNNLKVKTQALNIVYNFSHRSEHILHDGKIWKASPLPFGFMPVQLSIKKEICFANNIGTILSISLNGRKLTTGWLPCIGESTTHNFILYKGKNNKNYKKLKLAEENYMLQNKKTKHLILKLKNNGFLFLEQIAPITQYNLSVTSKISANPGTFLDIGEPFTEGLIDPHELLLILFKYHLNLDGLFNGTLRSVNKFQLLLVNSIQSIYQSQGVFISSKHIEIIIRQMTAKVLIKNPGDTPLLTGEIMGLRLMLEICKALNIFEKIKRYKIPQYAPLLLSATVSSLNKDGFLSAAGFQETKRILTKAAIEGNADWLRGLKECVIIGRMIPAGSSFLNYKNSLNNIYLFKD